MCTFLLHDVFLSWFWEIVVFSKVLKTWFDAQIAGTKDLTADIEATLSFEGLRIYVFELEKLEESRHTFL